MELASERAGRTIQSQSEDGGRPRCVHVGRAQVVGGVARPNVAGGSGQAGGDRCVYSVLLSGELRIAVRLDGLFKGGTVGVRADAAVLACGHAAVVADRGADVLLQLPWIGAGRCWSTRSSASSMLPRPPSKPRLRRRDRRRRTRRLRRLERIEGCRESPHGLGGSLRAPSAAAAAAWCTEGACPPSRE